MSWKRIVKSGEMVSDDDDLDKISKVGELILQRVRLMNGINAN